MIEIWQPRYKDRTVLIAKYKVCRGVNLIKFTKAKHLLGKVFSARSEDICKCPVQSNGRITCYVVPMDMLQLISQS